MTDTTTTDTDPAPPAEYGNGDTWADDGSDYFVPVELRTYYSAAEPPPELLRGFLADGVSVAEPREYERTRVVDRGDDTRAPTVVTETDTATVLVHHGGIEYYPVWLHQQRLTIAWNRKRAADRQAATEAAYFVCQLCGVKAANVRYERIPSMVAKPRRFPVVSCPACLPALDDAAHAVMVEREADRELPDGRRAGDVATEVIRAAIDTDTSESNGAK